MESLEMHIRVIIFAVMMVFLMLGVVIGRLLGIKKGVTLAQKSKLDDSQNLLMRNYRHHGLYVIHGMLDGRPINTVIPVDGTTQQRLIEWAFDGTLRVDYFVQFNRMNADHFAALHATKIAITHRIFSAGNVGVITIMPADDHSLLIRAILKVIEQERDPSQQVATPEKRQAYKDRVTQALNEYWAIVKSAGNRAGADRAEMFTMNMTEGGALMAEQMKEAFAMQTALDNCEIDSTHESPS